MTPRPASHQENGMTRKPKQQILIVASLNDAKWETLSEDRLLIIPMVKGWSVGITTDCIEPLRALLDAEKPT